MQFVLPVTKDCTKERLSDNMEKNVACLLQLYLRIKLRSTDHVIGRAEFLIQLYGHPREDELMTTARGDSHVRFGSNADRSSPEAPTCPLRLTTVDCEHFHEGLSVAGYGYWSIQSHKIHTAQNRFRHRCSCCLRQRSGHPPCSPGWVSASIVCS
jgi:hypothetical protein